MANEPEKAKSAEAGRAVAPRGGYLHPIQQLRQEMDRLFDGFFDGGGSRGLIDWNWDPFRELRGRAPLISLPQIDIHENDKAYVIEAELAGMSEKDVDLVVKDDVLTLKGEKKEEKKEEKKDYLLSERSYGSFQRSFRLPEGVDRDGISAEFKNGVLCVTLPKTAKAQQESKKIQIKS